MLKVCSLLAIVLIGLVGCSRGPEMASRPLTPEEQFTKGKPVKTYLANTPEFIILPPLEERRKLFIPGVNLSPASVNGDWRVADKRVHNFLDKYKEHPLLYADAQAYAAILLDQYLLLEKKDEQVQEAISFYVGILDYYQNNEFVIFAKSLQRLRKYWPEEKIKQVALRAQSRANKVLETSISAPETSPEYKQHQHLLANAKQSQTAFHKLVR